MKKKSMAIAGISALGLALVGSAAANAYAGTSDQTNTSMIGKIFNKAGHGQMQKVLETTDYKTWKDLVSKNPNSSQILEIISESNFSRFVEMQKLLMSGDKAGAEAIRVELGLPEIVHPENGAMGRGHFDKETNEAIRTAIENNDFSAWKIAIAKLPFSDKVLEKINESNFSQYVQMHILMKSGDKAGAQSIAENLGLEKPLAKIGHGKMMKHWLKNNKPSK